VQLHRKPLAKMTFYAFPKTPHLTGSSVVDDDAIQSYQSLLDLVKLQDSNLNTRVLIQEKIDGTNVSIHFEQDWIPICQKRAGIIESSGEKEQYNVFRQWVFERLEMLWNTLQTKYVLFGEFLW
jgi:hypothetical protein